MLDIEIKISYKNYTIYYPYKQYIHKQQKTHLKFSVYKYQTQPNAQWLIFANISIPLGYGTKFNIFM